MPRHRVGNPLVGLACLLVIACTGGLVNQAKTGLRRPLNRTVLVYEDSTTWRVYDMDVESTDRFFSAKQLLVLNSSPVTVTLAETIRRNGWWLPVSETVTVGPSITPSSGVRPTDSEIQTIVASWFDSNGEETSARLFRAGTVTTSRILWSGYFLNAVTLAAVLLLATSLATFTRWRRSRRVRRAFAKGLCPGCRYSLVGTPASGALTTCPECGDQSRADTVHSTQ